MAPSAHYLEHALAFILPYTIPVILPLPSYKNPMIILCIIQMMIHNNLHLKILYIITSVNPLYHVRSYIQTLYMRIRMCTSSDCLYSVYHRICFQESHFLKLYSSIAWGASVLIKEKPMDHHNESSSYNLLVGRLEETSNFIIRRLGNNHKLSALASSCLKYGY